MKLQPGDPHHTGAESAAAGTGDPEPGPPLPGYSYYTPRRRPDHRTAAVAGRSR